MKTEQIRNKTTIFRAASAAASRFLFESLEERLQFSAPWLTLADHHPFNAVGDTLSVDALPAGINIQLDIQGTDPDHDNDGTATVNFDQQDFSVGPNGNEKTFSFLYTGGPTTLTLKTLDDGDDPVVVTLRAQSAADAAITSLTPDPKGGVDVRYDTGLYAFSPSARPEIQLYYLTGDTLDAADLVPIGRPTPISSTPNVSNAVRLAYGATAQLPKPPTDAKGDVTATGVVATLVNIVKGIEYPLSESPLADANDGNDFIVRPLDQLLPDYQAVYLTQTDTNQFQLHYNVIGAPTPLNATPVVELVWAGASTANSYGYDKIRGSSPLKLVDPPSTRTHTSIELDPTSTENSGTSTEMDFTVDPATLAKPPKGATGIMAVLDYNNRVVEATRANNLAYHQLSIVTSVKLTSSEVTSSQGGAQTGSVTVGGALLNCPAGGEWTITGVALDADKNPVPNALVTMSDAVSGEKSLSLGTTDRNGQFKITYSAEETADADPGLYLSSLHSGSASLYFNYAITSNNIGALIASAPHTQIIQKAWTDSRLIDAPTLIYARKAPDITALPALSATNLVTWAGKVTADLVSVAVQSAADTIGDVKQDLALQIGTHAVFRPSGLLALELEPSGIAASYLTHFLENLVKKDPKLTPKQKAGWEAAISGTEIVADVAEFSNTLREHDGLLDDATIAASYIKVGIDNTKFLFKGYEALQKNAIGMTLVDSKGNVTSVAIAMTPQPVQQQSLPLVPTNFRLTPSPAVSAGPDSAGEPYAMFPTSKNREPRLFALTAGIFALS